jgi:putative transposase
MFLSFAYLAFSAVLKLLLGRRRNEFAKDVGLMVLCHQLFVLERQAARPSLRPADRAFLTALARVLPRRRRHAFVVTPQILLRWHRELLRHSGRSRDEAGAARRSTIGCVSSCCGSHARTRVGVYPRIAGELLKLGARVAEHRAPAAPRSWSAAGAEAGRPSWWDVLRQQAASVLACDFFTVETISLRRFDVLFFNELRSRRVRVAGCTTNPTGAWVTQQARNLSFTGVFERIRFLIHDRDSKFSGAFDDVFRSEGIKVIHTPILAPQANAYAERFVRTVRVECLDWLLIVGRRHLEQVLRTYTAHYG